MLLETLVYDEVDYVTHFMSDLVSHELGHPGWRGNHCLLICGFVNTMRLAKRIHFTL